MTFAIAHRGLSARYAENSLEAIAAALEHVHVVEVDVRCTHDAVPVCTHDASLKRVLGMDVRVGQVDLSELRDCAPGVPTLAEVLELVHERGGAAMLDVKVSRPRAIEAIVRTVDASAMAWNDGRQVRRGEPIDPGTLTFQSADATLLQAFRSRTGAGCLELVRDDSSVRELVLTAPFVTAYAQGVTIPERLVTRRLVRYLRSLRLGSYAYTVNDRARRAELEQLDVDAIYTDDVTTA